MMSEECNAAGIEAKLRLCGRPPECESVTRGELLHQLDSAPVSRTRSRGPALDPLKALLCSRLRTALAGATRKIRVVRAHSRAHPKIGSHNGLAFRHSRREGQFPKRPELFQLWCLVHCCSPVFGPGPSCAIQVPRRISAIHAGVARAASAARHESSLRSEREARAQLQRWWRAE